MKQGYYLPHPRLTQMDTIRDLKYGVGLNHLPSGRFGANAAWLALNVIAHNLSRWVGRIGLNEPLITHKTLRRRYLRISGRLTRSARQPTLHLPTQWPWAQQFQHALTNLRAVELNT
jgi:Transposase DDE domain group 1